MTKLIATYSEWLYYKYVSRWVTATFPAYHTIMKGLDWSSMYNRYHRTVPQNAGEMAETLFEYEDEISNPQKIFEAVLSGDYTLLHACDFSDIDKKWAYKKQGGSCLYCKKHFNMKQMHGDHIIPWSKGGKTDCDNLQMLCIECNRKKSEYDAKYNPFDNEKYIPFDLDKRDNH